MKLHYMGVVLLTSSLLLTACGGGVPEDLNTDPNMNDNIVLKQGMASEAYDNQSNSNIIPATLSSGDETNTNTTDSTTTTNSNAILKTNPVTTQSMTMKADGDQLAKPVSGEEVVVMETSKGTMKIRLFPSDAPNHVKNFRELISKGYYDGIIFHRVIQDFMIQGGDPTGTGTGGESYLGKSKPIADESNVKLKHLYGTVAMAKSGPDTAGSQFYIVNNKEGTPFLDSGYTAFGQVYEGFDVLDALSTVETDKCTPYERRLGCDKPLEDIAMLKVTLEKVK